MKIAELCVSRPVTTIMFYIGLMLFGVISLFNLPQELFPPISYPNLSVITPYENAAPEEIETLVTKPVEEAVGSVSGVRRVTSTSKEGLSIVIAEFDWNQNMDFAALGIREKIDLIKERLPRECEEPVVMKFNPFDLPVMTLSISGPYPPAELRDISEYIIKDEIEKINGVAAATVTGGTEREILVNLDQAKLEAYNIPIMDVVNSLRNSNLNYPGGTIKESFYEYLIRTLGEFTKVSEIGEIVVGTEREYLPEQIISQALEEPNVYKRPILLEDIAEVKNTFKERSSFSRYNGSENVTISVQKQAKVNTIQVAESVKKALQNIKDQIPKNVSISIVYDQSNFIKSSINGVKDSAWQGALLAFLVLLFFLRNVRSSLIVVLSIPISIMVTFTFMFFAKLSINMMSLGGLALGVGMLVDGAIVVIENIFRHRTEEKASVRDAAIKGTNEVTNAVTASILTTIAVFFPMVFMIGISGQLFKDLSFTIIFSLLASLLVSLTLVPLMATWGKEKGLKNITEKAATEDAFLTFFKAFYLRLLLFFLKRKKIALFSMLCLFVISLFGFEFIDKELMPKVDQGQFIVKIDMPAGTKIEITNDIVSKVENIIQDIPVIDNVTSIVGSTKGRSAKDALERLSANQGQIIVNLKKKRKIKAQAVVQDIKNVLEKTNLDGGKVEYLLQESILSSAFQEAAPIQIEVKGADLAILEKVADNVKETISDVNGVYGIKDNLTEPAPETKVFVIKEKAAFYNITVADVAQSAHVAIKGFTPTRFKEGKKEIDITVRLREEDRNDFNKLRRVLIHSPLDVNIPMFMIAYFGRGKGPSVIKRFDQERTVLVYANIYQRALNKVIEEIDQKLKTINIPHNYTVRVVGENQEMQESFQRLMFILILATLFVYMIMAAQFENIYQPFIIMLTIPMSIIGVVLILLITHTSLNVVVFLGLIMLGGIVVDNGIVLLDYLNILIKSGMKREEAAVKASMTRLRPILMTALTTILGVVPMTLASGEGSELQAPLAITVMGGLVVSTFLTIVILPSMYLFFEELKDKIFKVSKSSIKK